jgi:hypothetical protein
LKKSSKAKIKALQIEVDELRNHIKILEYRLGLVEYKDMPAWEPITLPVYPPLPNTGWPIVVTYDNSTTTLDSKPE